VSESVSVNGKLDHESDILDKIAVSVTDVKDDSGYHDASFQTSERAHGSLGTYEWSEEYASRFWRDGRGAYTVNASDFMPMVRDVPLFPEGELSPGDSWTARGEEVHDFRANFGIAEPFRFPITVDYSYVGNETRDGAACAVFSIDYEIFRTIAPPSGTKRMYPVRIAGYSRQKYWWDIAAKRPLVDEETFDFIYSFNSGDEVEYSGRSEGRLIPSQPMDREKLSQDIQSQVDSQKIPDVTVKPTDQGVTITLENVNFPPNSNTLLPAEQEKLRRIAQMLAKYPDRDILVTGHTARAAGYTEEDYQQLSEQRAQAAANFLLSIGARRPEQITARGMGARMPIGDNSTQSGMRMNRRVEITILEN
jgi:outer membrane protein OmpA-like peptidoglycan-associated protein